jgi:hypothetical protein
VNNLTEKKYPFIDLNDAQVIQEQRQNIARFKTLWLRVMIGYLGTFAYFFIAGEAIGATHSGLFVFILFLFIISTLFFLIMYKCPHCATIPSGTAVAIGAWKVTRTKGAHPFPKRCDCCGYYLAERALKADLRKHLGRHAI